MLGLIRGGRPDGLVVLSIPCNGQEGSGYRKALSIGRIIEAELKTVLETPSIGGMEMKGDFLCIPIQNLRATVDGAESESRKLAGNVATKNSWKVPTGSPGCEHY